MAGPSVDLEERRAELESELSQARSEESAAARRLEELERKRAARLALTAPLEDALEQAAATRSFRYGHGLLRRLAWLKLKRSSRRTALDDAARALADARRSLADPAAPAAVAAAGGGSTARAPLSATGGGATATGGGSIAKAPLSATGGGAAAASASVLGDAARGARRAATAAESEQAMREGFRARYAALAADPADETGATELAGPLARDRHGMLRATAGLGEPGDPGVDVIVCVRDAPDDVRTCLWALLDRATRPFHLIVVDDGSGPEAAALLDDLARREPAVELLRNSGPEHGYTRAANIGLRASTGAYAVLLNSDTIVTPRWLERIVACGESDERIGIVGPLSNAATHQSVPAVEADGGWAVNELPRWLTVDELGELTATLSRRERPRVPFVNGFCYAVKRAVVEAVGPFDEERFGSGYCEENDFSVRAQDAGFELAIADDAYVFHAKSRSYTPAGRERVARRNYERFLDKHGAGRVEALLGEMEQATAGLGPLRADLATATASEEATVAAFRAAHPEPREILFVLHGMPDGSSGGGHSIYQETAAMQRLGIPARIAIRGPAMDRARAAYPDADRVFVPYSGEDELAAHARTADVVVATHFTTVAMVARLRERGARFLPAYYVQDYEPFFFEPGSDQLDAARSSYTAIPDQVVFAKTHWLCNLVGRLHGIDVAKVEPSIDATLFGTAGRAEPDGGPVRVAAMIRPRTPRRQPVMTIDLLSDLKATHGGAVAVTTFGCPDESVERLGRTPPGEHRGLLAREQVAELLRASDVFLDASTYQAFGRTAIEAMACGATAVVPRIGGAAQFVRHLDNGLLADTLRPAAVAGALDSLVEDADLRDRLRSAAVAEARGYSTLRAALSEYAVFEREARA